ncbi:unnamed protein product [Gongylonema pulchrum]|uniref:TSP1_spondin domain-containing protein n=1 Tax=Gongylonema pulchrum TaxID=637853 RepID=A0A183DDH9_9BILA|nr:unnamed protein product [Gongylonema pulchrum]
MFASTPVRCAVIFLGQFNVFSVNCTAEWRPSVWGQCSRTCGDGGVQMRLLRCVWRGTRKAAGRNCQSSERPPALRACPETNNLPECPSGPSTGAAPAVLFKGWENWRGWRLYNWQPDRNGKLHRKI